MVRRHAKGLFAMLLILALALVGCGGSSTPPAQSGGGTPAPGPSGSEPEKKLKITLIEGVANDTFYISMARGAREKAQELGIEVDVQGALTWDVAEQTKVLNAVIAKKPDAILIAPTDRKGMYAPLKAAVDAGIPVILVDTTLDDASIALTNIASDNYEGGKEAAKALAELVGAKGKVFTLNTKPGISTSDERVRGFEDGLKDFPEIEYLGVQFNDDDTTKATSVTSAMLQRNPDLAGIFVTNQIGGMGANVALKNAQKADEVKMVEFDGGPDQVKALKEGIVQSLIVQKPLEIGAKGVEVAAAYLRDGKKDFEAVVTTGFVVATQENMEDPEISKYFYVAD